MKQTIGAYVRANPSCLPCGKQLQKLGAYSFAREAGKAVSLANGCRTPSRIELAFAEIGRKTEEAQDAQIVLRDAPGGLAYEAHFARRDVVEAASVIEQPSLARHGKRVHRKIAAQRIDLKIAAEKDIRMAAVGRDVLAQGCYFERPILGEHRDRAVRDAGRDGAQAGGRCLRHDGRGKTGGREVNFMHRPSQERIAQGAADNAGFLAFMIERGKNAAQAFVVEQRGEGLRRLYALGSRLAHCRRPGTSFPFSMWAGT